jgi:uncharacterized protein (TIGR02246 family)
MTSGDAPSRPTLHVGGTSAHEAREALALVVDELQTGWDRHDADISNRHVAADVMWGSPFGATVRGYDELHAIHGRLKQRGVGGPASRFEIVDVLVPAPGIAIAQVRRVALGVDGEAIEPTDDAQGSFSEMAMYVLVRRDRTWWLAAGQNTPIQPPPSD